MKSFSCWDKFKDSDLHKYLAEKTGIAEPATPKGLKAYRQATQQLQHETLNNIHNIYNKIGIKGFENTIEQQQAFSQNIQDIKPSPTEKVVDIEGEKKAIETWLDNSDEHSDYVSFDWDGKNLEIFKSRDEAPIEISRKELEQEGVDFPERPQVKQEKNNPPVQGEPQGSNITVSKIGKYETKAREIVAKIDAADIPQWLINTDPTIQKQGISGEAIKELLKKAIINVGKALDKGVELVDAIKEAADKLVKDYGSLIGLSKGATLKPEFENQLRSGFENYYNENSTQEEPAIENEVISDEPLADDAIGAYKMTRSTEITKAFGSNTTQANVFDELPSEEKFHVQMGMLQDGKNMIGAAQSMFGSTDINEYGPKLFRYIQQMKGDDAELTNKRAVLLATFLGEIKNEMIRNQASADALRPLNNSVSRYYTNFMHVTAKNLAAGRLLRLFRDKYMGDVFRDKILEEKEIRAANKAQNAEADNSISNEDVVHFNASRQKGKTQDQINTERKDSAERRKSAQEAAKGRKASKREIFGKLASDKEADINIKYGNKKGLVQTIIDRIKQIKDCK